MRPVPQVEKLLPRGTCRHETTGGAKQKGEDIDILPPSETGSGGASTGKESGDSAGDPNRMEPTISPASWGSNGSRRHGSLPHRLPQQTQMRLGSGCEKQVARYQVSLLYRRLSG